MTLRQQQSKFVRMVSLLIHHATELGCELTFGDAYAHAGHRQDSFHYKRLAIDLNLFINGKYQITTEAHRPLGEYWESIGGSWGGYFENPDGNHYSLGEK